MQVVEFEPERALAFSVHDANMKLYGRATFETKEPDRTQLTVTTDIPGLEDPAAKEVITKGMERSIANVKTLVEAET
jgi:hypothetical protein